MEEPIWEAAVSFLDEDGGSGWNFIEILLSARAVRAPANSFREAPAVLDPTARLVTARALMESPFLTRQLR